MATEAPGRPDVTAETQTDDPLMDIHEAARFLRISAVSVRRHTNAGTLPCLRVGGRRERRFRRSDLEAFLGAERLPDRGNRPSSRSAGNGRMHLDGLDIPYGSHLCQLYESDRGRVQMAVPFLADGLAAGDKCFLIGSDANRRSIVEALKSKRGRLADDLSGGRLQVLPCAPSGREMLETLDDAFGAALQAGFAHMRLVGDMSWFLDRGLSADELVDFETRYDSQIGHSYPIVSLCLYDARRFSGVGILHALRCHSDTFNLPLARFLLR